MRSKLAALLIAGGLLLPLACAGAQTAVPPRAVERSGVPDSEWHWVMVGPGQPDSWATRQGVAKNVRFEGGKFHADLYDAKWIGGDPAIRLDGRIAQRRITATETLIGTDAEPQTFRGSLQKIRPAGKASTASRSQIYRPISDWCAAYRRRRTRVVLA